MTVPKKISEIVHKITPQEIYLHYGFYKFKKNILTKLRLLRI